MERLTQRYAIGTALAALLAAAQPAAAQSWLFSPRPIAAVPQTLTPREAPPAPPAAAPVALRQEAALTETSPAAPDRTVTMPVPPRRPSDLPLPPLAAAEAPPPVSLSPVPTTPSAPPRTVAALSPAQPLSERGAVERVNAYLNSFTTLTGRFVQRAGGRQTTGTLYLHRPGRLRFEYDRPSNLEIVADGNSVAIRDRRLNTQDLYALNQTPLKFLVGSRVELGRDLAIKDVDVGADTVRVTVEDRSTLGGTSRVTLVYDPAANVLRQWTIVDAAGAETTVVLDDLKTGQTPDPGLFRINYERMIDTDRR